MLRSTHSTTARRRTRAGRPAPAPGPAPGRAKKKAGRPVMGEAATTQPTAMTVSTPSAAATWLEAAVLGVDLASTLRKARTQPVGVASGTISSVFAAPAEDEIGFVIDRTPGAVGVPTNDDDDDDLDDGANDDDDCGGDSDEEEEKGIGEMDDSDNEEDEDDDAGDAQARSRKARLRRILGESSRQRKGAVTTAKKRSNVLSLSDRPAVWTDEADFDERVDLTAINRLRKLRSNEKQTIVNGFEYQAKLRQQLAKLRSSQRWSAAFEAARLEQLNNDNSEDDEITMLLARSGKLTRKSTLLPQTALDIARVRDLNETSRTEAVIEAMQFHPSGRVAFTAGLDKTIHLFQVDGKVNEKIQSVHFHDLPIYSAAFTPDGRQVFASGRRKFFYTYDVEAGVIERVPSITGHAEKSLESMVMSPTGDLVAFMGNQGLVMLVSTLTKQWIADLRMNGSVRSIAFSRDGRSLYTFGGDGDVYIWDIAQRRCIHQFHDDGCLHGTTIAVSPDGTHIACGSNSGVVNLYDHRVASLSATPTPEKAFMNLITDINLLGFNNDGQILAMGSKQKRDAFKLAHVASRSVFANWPASNTPIHHGSCFNFSPNNGYFALANDRGRALLFRLKHYNAV